MFESLASCFAFRCSAPLNMATEKSAVVAQITPHCENFVRNLYSRIDNTRLNFRLAIPEVLQIEKF